MLFKWIYKLRLKLKLKKIARNIEKDFSIVAEGAGKTPLATKEALRSTNEIGTVDNLIEEIKECINVIGKTNNPSIVLDRTEYGILKSYKLKQLEEIGFYQGDITAEEYANWFRNNKEKHINRSIERGKASINIGNQDVFKYRKRTYFSKDEEELAFDFSKCNKDKLSLMEDEFHALWSKNNRGQTVEDKINQYELSLMKLYEIKNFCFNFGRGGEVYYLVNWEEMFNSRNPSFSQESLILREIDYWRKQQNKIVALKGISDEIINEIKLKEKLYQKDLYRMFPEMDRDAIKTLVNELTANDIIIKTKKSNSYELKIK